MVTSAPDVSDLAVSPSTLAGTRAATEASGVCGFQVSSRCERRKRSVASSDIVEPSISMRTPVSTGQHVVATGGGDRLGDGVGEVVAGDGAGRGRHLRELGVVLDRHGLEAEAGGAAGQRDPGPVELHLDRLGRQAATDVGEQPAADQGAAVVADLGREVGAGRGLVVEGGEHQAGVAGLDEQAREHRGSSDGPGGCEPPRQRHRRRRRVRRGTSLRAPRAVERARGRSGWVARQRSGQGRTTRTCPWEVNPAMRSSSWGGAGQVVPRRGPVQLVSEIRSVLQVRRSNSVCGNCGQLLFSQVRPRSLCTGGVHGACSTRGSGCARRRAVRGGACRFPQGVCTTRRVEPHVLHRLCAARSSVSRGPAQD